MRGMKNASDGEEAHVEQEREADEEVRAPARTSRTTPTGRRLAGVDRAHLEDERRPSSSMRAFAPGGSSNSCAPLISPDGRARAAAR